MHAFGYVSLDRCVLLFRMEINMSYSQCTWVLRVYTMQDSCLYTHFTLIINKCYTVYSLHVPNVKCKYQARQEQRTITFWRNFLLLSSEHFGNCSTPCVLYIGSLPPLKDYNSFPAYKLSSGKTFCVYVFLCAV